MTFESAGPVLFGTVSAVTATRGPSDPEVGATKTIGSREYVYVYNAGGSTIDVGMAGICSAAISGALNVTVSSVSGVNIAVGVCQNTAIPTLNYGWLMTKGLGVVEMGNFSATAGDGLTLAGDGLFDVVSGFTGTLAPIGNAQAAIASAASGQAYIRC